MALIKCAYCFLDDDEVFEAFMNCFDSVELIKDVPHEAAKIFRVQREEVPKEDELIEVWFYKFEGVLPFMIEWEKYSTAYFK